MKVLEFWPEYNIGPLWSPGGAAVDHVDSDLLASIRQRLGAWGSSKKSNTDAESDSLSPRPPLW